MHETHLKIANLSLHIWFLYDLVVSAISIVSCSAIQMKVWFQELPSVNSLFIFPQDYTRLKYWSTRPWPLGLSSVYEEERHEWAACLSLLG